MNETGYVCPSYEIDLSNDSVCNYFQDDCQPDRPYFKVPIAEFVVKLFFYLLVFTASFLGNVIVILVVYLYRAKMQSSAYMYLLNLSVAGLIIAIGCMWPYFMVSVTHEYPLGDAMCKILPFLQRKYLQLQAQQNRKFRRRLTQKGLCGFWVGNSVMNAERGHFKRSLCCSKFSSMKLIGWHIENLWQARVYRDWLHT